MQREARTGVGRKRKNQCKVVLGLATLWRQAKGIGWS